AAVLLGPTPPEGETCSAPMRTASSVAPVELHPDPPPEEAIERAAVPTPTAAPMAAAPVMRSKARPPQLVMANPDSLRLIARMPAAAAAGGFALVLELASEHEKQFPREQVRERLGQRISALCALGREAEAHKIIAAHPEHSVLARACGPASH